MLLSCHQNAGQNWDIIITTNTVWKCVTFQLFGNNCNKSKFDSGN
jgi:hypothetical protein